jgi:hypothetical protein
MRPHLEIKPLRVWYYHISTNFHTLVILSQVDPVSGDEPETIYEGFYEIEDPPSSHGFQFLALDSIVDCAI